MIKNLVFDMGNVLLTYNPEVCLDYFLTREEDKAVIRRELFEGAEWEQGDLGLLTDIERFYEVRKRVPKRLHEALKNCAVEWPMCMKPVSGAREFCDFARKNGYKLYVLSNASSSFYNYFPNFAPFTYFDGILVSRDVGMIKPDGRIYQHLFEKYALKPEECFFVDDRRENIEAARQEGMEGIVFEGDYDVVRQTLTEVSVEKVRDTLQASADTKYMEFNRSLVPGEIAPMFGVRMPGLREIAKSLPGQAEENISWESEEKKKMGRHITRSCCFTV